MGEKLDVVIFGATGFTGEIVVKDAVELLRDLKWAIAGRNKGRLENVLREVGGKTSQDLSKIPIIVADVKDQASIREMVRRTRIVINCCGPYRFYGEVVVKECIEAGVHHVDISGEPQYIDSMQLRYDDHAKEHGSYIVSTCGFECIPAEMGVRYVERNFPGTVNSIEMFWENYVKDHENNSRVLLHYGTWESVIYALSSPRELVVLRTKISRSIDLPDLRPKLHLNPFVRKVESLGTYFIPFPLTDRAVVHRTQQLLYQTEHKRPIQFETYLGFRSFLLAFLILIYGLLLIVLAQFYFTRKLLLKHPRLFTFGVISHRGPPDENMQGLHSSMTFKAKGWRHGQSELEAPGVELVARVSGYDPFYGLTSLSLLQSARIILKETARLPGRGGVLSPGAAFAKTSLIEALSQHLRGLRFEILESKK